MESEQKAHLARTIIKCITMIVMFAMVLTREPAEIHVKSNLLQVEFDCEFEAAPTNRE